MWNENAGDLGHVVEVTPGVRRFREHRQTREALRFGRFWLARLASRV